MKSRITFPKPSKLMLSRQKSNYIACLSNQNENKVLEELKKTGHTWRRQVIHGFKVFDFWCEKLGLRVEVDGLEHDIGEDRRYDEFLFQETGIITIRVPNGCDQSIREMIVSIGYMSPWSRRVGSIDKSCVPHPYKHELSEARNRKILAKSQAKETDCIMSNRQLRRLAKVLGIRSVWDARRILAKLHTSKVIPVDLDEWKRHDASMESVLSQTTTQLAPLPTL